MNINKFDMHWANLLQFVPFHSKTKLIYIAILHHENEYSYQKTLETEFAFVLST